MEIVLFEIRTVPKLFTKRNQRISGQNGKPEVVSKELSTKMGNLKEKVLLTNLVSCKVIEFEREKIWKVLGSATEWVGRGSIGWAGAVSAVPLPKSDFQHIKKVF